METQKLADPLIIDDAWFEEPCQQVTWNTQVLITTQSWPGITECP